MLGQWVCGSSSLVIRLNGDIGWIGWRGGRWWTIIGRFYALAHYMGFTDPRSLGMWNADRDYVAVGLKSANEGEDIW